MASYNTSDFRPGLKILLDGEPYLMIERNFVKPGKGQALYKCKVRNLLKGTVLDRTWKSGDSVDAADVEEIDELNILHATMLAMRRAADQLDRLPRELRIDGNRAPELPGYDGRTTTIVGGDRLCPAISAASILAKVARDDLMLDLDER